MQNLTLSSISPNSMLQTAPCSALDMSLAVDQIATMFLKELAVKDAIVSDLRMNLPAETLSVYITTWKVKPHLDELFIESLKEKLKLFDQVISAR